MKRLRRSTIRRGLGGRSRRRLARRAVDVARGSGPGCYARTEAARRDARRLVDAGLAVAVVSKVGLVSKLEFTLFRTREEAPTRYALEFLVPRRGR